MLSNTNNESANDGSDTNHEQLVGLFERVNISDATVGSFGGQDNAFTSTTDSSSTIYAIESDSADTTLRSQVHVQNNSLSYQKPACEYGLKCFNTNCPLDHPSEWQVCRNGSNCKDFYCKATHPYDRQKPCLRGHNCKRFKCRFMHPSSTFGECLAGTKCRIWQCQARHPDTRPKDCSFGESCFNNACPRPHPPTRQVCSNGIECAEFYCRLKHPPGRVAYCEQSILCSNFYCADLHPPEWDPCEAGSNCVDIMCSHMSHPANRILQQQQLQQENSSGEMQSSSSKPLKSIEQRQIEREKARLPILAAKEEFCQRLEKERVLVVRAETGSGKSTQLPQYAAEYFGGLVVCTQPRVIAAMSLARRVAKEYDGLSVGQSVGYRVGHVSVGKDKYRVPGRDILFVTDAALIQENQESGLLRDTRVLIIDEAHERSLYTDIVIGMAKLLLATRPIDFYVVISSATVDPSKFLDFFKLADSSILHVPGRLHDVSIVYNPKLKGSIEEHAISTLLTLYARCQGHTLVFLPGSREIQRAIEIFNSKIPADCVALPLYAALSAEEQNRVLQFDEDANNEIRMVVFCTNIAETSVTINNVRLVIDCGLVKEARFDNERRLTIIETMKISRSSADQRTGRAGRTAPGRCVRLYRLDDLIRQDIEPAILRSSLDLVTLQIICLQINPRKFPFIDPPDATILEASFDLLEQLSCIDTDHTITRRGQLFSELSFDPRYSAFLVDTYLEHGPILDLIATVVAILVTPGFRSDMVGALPEEKDAARNRIIDGAKDNESDLLCLVSIFRDWCSAGQIDSVTRQCQICHVPSAKKSSCACCRAAYSLSRLLNNRSLCAIENIYEATIKALTSPRWDLSPGSLVDREDSDILGVNLCKHFPERYGHILVKRARFEDAVMVKNNFLVALSENSVLFHRKIVNPHFIAMSIVKLSSGKHLIDQLHPCQPPTKSGDGRIKTIGSMNA
ncbi:unnamed protein product [Rotaria socialis]|nr:unnamed protein product [Rotaria socialis]